jgi:hypothetical protein
MVAGTDYGNLHVAGIRIKVLRFQKLIERLLVDMLPQDKYSDIRPAELNSKFGKQERGGAAHSGDKWVNRKSNSSS